MLPFLGAESLAAFRANLDYRILDYGSDADHEIIAFFIAFRELGKLARMLATD